MWYNGHNKIRMFMERKNTGTRNKKSHWLLDKREDIYKQSEIKDWEVHKIWKK